MKKLIGNMMNANNIVYFYFLNLGFYFYSAGYFTFKKSYNKPMRYSLYYRIIPTNIRHQFC